MLIGVDASRAVVARRTGTELYSLRLIEALLSLDVPHRFRLYLNRSPQPLDSHFTGLLFRSARVELRTISFPRLWTHVRLGLELALHPPDVLFVPSHVVPLWTRIPAVVTVHDLGYLFFPQAHPARQRWYLDWSTRHSVRAARLVIADSQATRSDLVKHYAERPGKVIVAYPGRDEELAPVSDPVVIGAARHRYGIQQDYFIHIGTLQPRKNLSRLIEAFAMLPSAARAQLVLAGKKGWLYDELFRLVRRLGLEGRVLFVGYLDDADKAALLSGAIACVFPSLYEGFGFPALEAQACDIPLICANGSSLPEVAGDGALLVDPMDVSAWSQAMARLSADAALRAELVFRGRRNLARFSWRSCAETVMGALSEAAQVEG